MTYTIDTLTDEQRDHALDRSINGLRDDDPLRSAAIPPVMGWQKGGFLAVVLLAVVVFAIWRPMQTGVAMIGLCTFGYVLTMADRVMIFRRGLAARPITVTDEQARALTDDELPPYTILVPAYNEPEVVDDLIGAMARLEYPPKDKLQVLLLLEADDDVTIEAARRCKESEAITILLVPPADPRTKPKACNYGLHFATGDIVTIFDAEDLPEPPLQLRRVVAAFAELPDDIACVQAKLAYHNGRQNMLTGWFTAEYGLWFGYLLPGMMRTGTPIPLGGTSNHLKRSVLDHIGAWDPHNVTEDADLGLRIARRVITRRCWIRRPSRRPTATRSTGSGSGPGGTRATCRPGWCTSAARSSCCAPSGFAASCGSTWCWRAPRSSRCSTWRSG